MAELKSFRIEVKNLNAIKVNLNQLANRAQRMQHLVKELQEGLIDLENDMNNISFDFVPEKTETKQEG